MIILASHSFFQFQSRPNISFFIPKDQGLFFKRKIDLQKPSKNSIFTEKNKNISCNRMQFVALHEKPDFAPALIRNPTLYGRASSRPINIVLCTKQKTVEVC